MSRKSKQPCPVWPEWSVSANRPWRLVNLETGDLVRGRNGRAKRWHTVDDALRWAGRRGMRMPDPPAPGRNTRRSVA